MQERLSFWEEKHKKFLANHGDLKPSLFVRQIAGQLKPGSKVLELGCGYGRDALFLAEQGHHVVATEFSTVAIEHFPPEAERLGIEVTILNIADVPYPFEPDSFDVVYAHLSLHYFSRCTTKEIFSEVARLLICGGKFFGNFNSIRDIEFGTGTQIEPSYFELAPGNRKRFFSTEEMTGLLPANLRVDYAEYGQGTLNNKDDQFLMLAAIKGSS